MRRGLLLILLGCGRLGFDAHDRSDGATGDGPLGDRPPATLTNNVVFATRVVDVGALGGLAGADAACQAAAADVQLPGTYVAWLSTSTVNAIDRIAGARGWVRIDGVPFADLPADIVAGRALAPPVLDPRGLRANPNVAATGTLANGTSSGQTCSDWTTTAGQPTGGTTNATAGVFTANSVFGGGCSGPATIYCFGIDRTNALVITPATGRLAFVSTPWNPGNGLADADAHCQTNASTQGLTQPFIAVLGTAADPDPKVRLDTSGPPWVRLDGLPLAATAADTFLGGLSGTTRIAPLNRAIDGTYVAQEHVWTGFDVSFPSSCGTWIQTGAGQQGSTSLSAYQIGGDLFGAGQASTCNLAHRLYCFEP